MFWQKRILCFIDYTTASNSVLYFREMLSLNSLRLVCSSRAVLHLNWQMANRLFVSNTVKCFAHCMSTSFLSKDLRYSTMNVRALRKESGLIYYANQVNSPVNYCTGQVRLNCWNCNQRLHDRSVFFCMSCKVVQPPEEETSYFKIMDWWVSCLPNQLCFWQKRFID